MKIQELRGRDQKALKHVCVEKKRELMKLRFLKATDQLTNPSTIRLTKRAIARIKTVLREVSKEIVK